MPEEKDNDRVARRLTAFRQELSAQGVPNATYPEYPNDVLVNIGGGDVPYQGFVQCWIKFSYKEDVVVVRLKGGDALKIRPGRRKEALEAINSINGREWWATAYADDEDRIGLTATFWLDDSSCGRPLFFLMRDMSQIMLNYVSAFV